MKLTLPQQDVYYEQLLYPELPIYNIGAKIAIKGNIIYEILNRAYVVTIDQHDAYRSIVVQGTEDVEMQILSEHTSVLGFVDFSKNDFPDEEANRYMQATFNKAFDLNSGELLHKFILIKVNNTFHYLFSMYHHIITDGWGTSLMFQRLVKNYNELINDGTIADCDLYTYTAFAEDDIQYYNSDAYKEDKEYWKSKFQHLPEGLFEKTDKNVSLISSRRKELIVERAVYNQIEAVALVLKCSTFHVILGILYLYFGRKHKNTDFAIGLPILNRSKAVFKKTVGLFMGISALRMQFSYDDTFEELVSNIKRQLRQDYRHQRFPLGKLIQTLDVFSKKEQLFNVMLSYEKQDYADHFADTDTRVIPLTHGAERIGLAIYIREFNVAEDVKIDFDYNLNYFDEISISNLAAHFEQLLVGVCSNLKMPLSFFNYLTGEEEQLLALFNKTKTAYPKDHTILSFFHDQVKNNPDSIAVTDEISTYTYQELDIISDRIAFYLLNSFVKDIFPVAVLMPRSANLVATLLGVLKSGNSYIPLDPDFPEERLKYIVSHSKSRCVIGTNDHQSIVSGIPFIAVNTIIDLKDEVDITKLPKVKFSDSAYIIYTSGSTGNPKGVVIGHQSLLNFLLSMQQEPGFNAGDVFFSVTTQSFDISMLEFFGPLISGGTLYIATKEVLSDTNEIIAKLKAVDPDILQATPSFYQMLCDSGWKGNKKIKILCGGDLLNAPLAEMLIKTCSEVWNMYGPTETTIWSSVKQLHSSASIYNIGRPINNTQFYILDECLKSLPVGCAGAIYIGGDGLAKGYYEDEILTVQRFIVNPFHTNEKIYETGDLGKWNSEGEIEFLGRNDQQVKIRGYRIELGEIETKINLLPSVKSSIVIVKKNEFQEAFLVAYIIPALEVFDASLLIRSLQKELPEYMVPHIMIPVEDYPLTPNKKIDRKSLGNKEVTELLFQPDYVRPVTYLEIEICRLFKEALKWEGNIGAKDNFFFLGGHSLNAVKVVNQIQKQLHYQISLKTIFDYPTAEMLSDHLKYQVTVIPGIIKLIDEASYYPASASQYAIWLAAQKSSGESRAYNVFVAYEIIGEIDSLLLEQSFISVLKKYEILRTNFIEIEGTPYQKIIRATDVHFQIDTINISDLQKAEAVSDYVNREFDLAEGILVRLGLFKTDTKYLLAFSTHHIIMDGWSVEILINEIVSNYKMKDSENEILNFQFKDYVAWLSDVPVERKESTDRFWDNYLDNYDWEIPMGDIYKDEINENLAGEFNFRWEGEFLNLLKGALQKEKTTLHNFLLSAFIILLHKVRAQNDLCIGTINSGRTIADLQDQIGMFVKTLPLRTHIVLQQTVSELMKAVHRNLLEINTYQDLPESIYNRIKIDVLFVLQPITFNYKNIIIEPGLSLKSYPAVQKYSRIPLAVNFAEDEDSLGCTVTYNTGMYTREDIEILFLRYEILLNQIIQTTDITIKDTDTNTAFENKQKIDIEFEF